MRVQVEFVEFALMAVWQAGMLVYLLGTGITLMRFFKDRERGDVNWLWGLFILLVPLGTILYLMFKEPPIQKSFN